MTDRLRIAMIAACPFPWPRGTPIRIHRMAEALAQRGHEVHVVTYHLGEELCSPPFVVHRIRDVPRYRHTAPGPTLRKLAQLDPMLVRLLRHLQGEMRFDVVHAHHYEGILVASRAHQSAPIIYDAHTLLAGELPHYRLGLPRRFTRAAGAYLDRRLPQGADRTIAVSESIRDTLVAIGAARPEQVHVIPNGVDWERFRVEQPVRCDGRTVIFTGNLSPYQRVDLLIEAFATLRARRADARLMIVTGSSFAPYEPLARQLGVREAIDLRNAPFAQEPALLAGAAVAVNPRTQCDGLPMKLLNYMAAAAPIVSFDGSAVHLEHERTGLRVADGDTAAMADAIERLLDDRILARQLGDAAREQVRRDFSWDGVAGRVEQVYREAIAGRTIR
jgi:glycosyltransferase involved in cell wall biosynthesis